MARTKTGIFIAGAFAAAMIAAVLALCAPNSAWAAQESEPNDSFNTADSFTIGENVYGQSRWTKVNHGLYDTLVDDKDYFVVNIPAAMTYKFTCANDDFGDNWRSVYFEIYDQYAQRIKTYGLGLGTTKPKSENLQLSKGRYYVVAYVQSEYQTHQYHFKFTPVVNKTSITKVVAGKKSATVKFKKKLGSSKYEVRYSLKSSMKSAKVKTVKASKSSVKVTKLKKNKKYYFQVRVVKNLEGKSFYSGWSAKKSVKIVR